MAGSGNELVEHALARAKMPSRRRQRESDLLVPAQCILANDKVRSIVALLESKGVWVEMVTTADPGIILYEDQWQIVAKPRRKRLRAQGSQLIGTARTRNTFRKSDGIEVSHSGAGR